MIPRRAERYDRVVVAGDVIHLPIRLDTHDALRYFDLREDDGTVSDVVIRQTHAESGETTTHDAEVTGAREVQHTFSADSEGEFRIRARVTLDDGRELSVPTTDPVLVWVAKD